MNRKTIRTRAGVTFFAAALCLLTVVEASAQKRIEFLNNGRGVQSITVPQSRTPGKQSAVQIHGPMDYSHRDGFSLRDRWIHCHDRRVGHDQVGHITGLLGTGSRPCDRQKCENRGGDLTARARERHTETERTGLRSRLRHHRRTSVVGQIGAWSEKVSAGAGGRQ